MIATMNSAEHTATLEPAEGTWVIERNGAELARSDDAVLLIERFGERTADPVVYFPPDVLDGVDVIGSDLHTTCPIKGQASYYSVRDGDDTLTDAIWYYPDPLPPLAPIAGYVAFYPNRFTVRPA